MTEKDRIDDLYDIAVLDRALYREEFRRQVESHQPPIRETESECNCKGGRHCEFCRKADSGGSVIEKLNEVSPEVRNNINPDIVNLWDKLNEVIDRINKQ